MSTYVNKSFRTTDGVNAYDPELVAEELTFFYLTNVEPRLGRLFATRGYAQFQSLASALSAVDELIGFSFYQLSTRTFVNLYVFSKTSVYWFNFSSAQFSVVPIYTGFYNSYDPYVFLPWYDALYVTKFLSPYVKLQRKIAAVVAGAPSARYGLVANSHAYLGGINDGVTSQLSQIRWSDLDAPESFAFSSNDSEADFFDLEPDSMEITGLSYQRSSTVVYALNTIWAGTPIGFPGGFRHDPIFPGLGNIFHNAVVRAKEQDFFIGPDNIYALNGLQPIPIGDKIYERFIADVDTAPVDGDSTVSVRGYLDSRKGQVFWVYKSLAQEGLWSIVFNYKESKWSERDPQDIRGWMDSPRVALRGYDAIDDISTIIDDDEEIIDDPTAGYPIVLPQLTGNLQLVGQATGAIRKIDGVKFNQLVETTDFFFEDFLEVKEITKVSLAFTKVGTPNLTVQVGSRAAQSDAIVWSDATRLAVENAGCTFFIRSQGVGKFIRFRFSWNNDDLYETNYVNDIRLLSMSKVEDDDADNEK